MADITNELRQINTAHFGREVRGSIYSAIKKVNDDYTAQSIQFGDFAYPATGIWLDGSSVAYRVSSRRIGCIVLGSFTSSSDGKVHVATIKAAHLPFVNAGVYGVVNTGVGTYQPISGTIDATTGQVYIYTPNIDTSYDGVVIYLDYYSAV